MSWFTLIVSTLALLLISLTMLLRCHDFDEKGGKAMVRKIGLLFSGAAPIGIILGLWFGWNLQNWIAVFSVSLFMVFFTTPNGVPWTKWVWNGLQKVEKEIVEELGI